MKSSKCVVVFFICFISFSGLLCSNDIVRAVLNSDLVALQKLVAQKYSLHLRCNMSGKNLLFRTSDDEVLDFLLEYGLEIDSTDYSGATPLIDAIKNNDNNKAIYLLNHGANSNITDLNGKSVLWYAIEQVNDWFVRYIVENDAELTSEMIQMARETYQNYRNTLEGHRANGVDEDRLYRIRELFNRARAIKDVLEDRFAAILLERNNDFLFMLMI